MKQLVTSYSYSPTTNVVTLTGVNIDQDQLLLVVAPQVGRTMYNFASGVTGVVSAGANTRVTLNASTAGLTTTSPLVIFYDDHVPATSVTGTVALDPASLIALENITVTVGSSVSISNLPSVQAVTFSTLPRSTVTVGNTVTVAGTVIANLGNAGFYDDGSDAIRIGLGNVNGTLPAPWLEDNNSSVPISGTVTIGSSVTIASLPSLAAGTAQIGSVTASISGTPSVTFGSIAGVVTSNNSNAISLNTAGSQYSYRVVSKSSLQFFAIAGAEDTTKFSDTYNVFPLKITSESEGRNLAVDLRKTQASGGSNDLSAISNDSVAAFVRTQVVGGSVTVGNTITARLQDSTGIGLTSTTVGSTSRLNVTLASAITTGGALPPVINVYGGSDSGTVRALAVDSSGRTVVTGTVTPSILDFSRSYSASSVTALRAHVGWGSNAGAFFYETNTAQPFPVQVVSSGTISVSQTGTVTVSQSAAITVGALPSGALTTRFGSVTTANLSQITTAVTNTSRKYLLAQNISTGSVTIGIGFSPTTTQGIQLTAGAGLTFDAFCPTGAVYWLGAVTGAAWTILEG